MYLHLQFARLRVPLLPLLTILCCTALTVLGAEDDPSAILLRDFKPRVLHRVPVTTVEKARYPIIDVHSHAYARTPEQIDRWVRTKDEVGIERTILLTGATGQRFDTLHAGCRWIRLHKRGFILARMPRDVLTTLRGWARHGLLPNVIRRSRSVFTRRESFWVLPIPL
jgi:hypothetical protein